MLACSSSMWKRLQVYALVVVCLCKLSPLESSASYVSPIKYPRSVSSPNGSTVTSGGSNGSSHNLIVGTPGWGDRLLLEYYLNVPREFYKVIKKRVVYPHPGVKSNITITSVQCWDQKKDGTGAYPIIQEGGPGKKNVTIDFVSQKYHGIKFIIKVLGR